MLTCFAKQYALGTRQIHGEGGPFSRGALDGDPAAVVLRHMPHYGESQPRSAGSLGAGLIHAVETLEDAWDLPSGMPMPVSEMRIVISESSEPPTTSTCPQAVCISPHYLQD